MTSSSGDINMHRRDFIKASGLSLLAAGTPLLAGCGAPARRWGLQLFTVIVPLEQDFEGTLRQIAAMGYKDVETIGSFGRDPVQVRALLDKYGLASPAQHIATNYIYSLSTAYTKHEISSDEQNRRYVAAFALNKVPAIIEEAIATAKVLGQKYVIWPILLPEQYATRQILDGYIGMFNRAGEMCAAAGMTFGFHNHAREFDRIGNDVIYDVILANTDPGRVAMELDLYWTVKAGVDPAVYLKRHRGRFRTCHVKDMAANGDFTTVGTGTIDFKTLLPLAEQAGVKHFFVEYDRPADPLRAVRESLAYVKELSF